MSEAELLRQLARLDEERRLNVTPEAPGRYALLAEQGRGSQAVVWLALDRHLNREVALKQLVAAGPSVLGSSLVALGATRFLREARITAQLEHPGIVPVYELGRREDGTLYATWRLLRGQTLAAALAQCADLPARLRLLPALIDVAQALAFAHGHGVLHRDLKPANVILCDEGGAVLLDWGLAQVRGGPAEPGGARVELPARAAADLTLDGTVIGTPAYMSPEQAAGKSAQLDERSEVFSLGALLFELLTGRAPFVGKDALEVVAQAARDEVPEVRSLCPEAPPELAAVARRALSRDPAARYSSARELAAEVEAFRLGARVRALRYSSWQLLLRLVQRYRAAALLAALALATALGAGLLLAGQAAQARRALAGTLAWRAGQAEDEAQWPLAAVWFAAARATDASAAPIAGPGLSRTALRGGLLLARLEEDRGATCVAFSPDGARLAVASSSQVHLWDASTHASLGRISGPAEVRAVAFSPDGRTLATASADKLIRLWDLSTLQQLDELAGHQGAVTALAFAPGGRRLASSSRDGTVRLWELSRGGNSARSLAGHTRGFLGLAFASDGRALAAGDLDGRIHLWDPETGAPLATLRGHDGLVASVALSPDGAQVASLGFDDSLRLWDRKTGQEVARLVGRAVAGAVQALAYSADGALLAAPGPDDSVLVWDPHAARRLARLDGHANAVRSLAFAPGDTLATASLDRSVALWDLSGPRAPRSFALGDPQADLAAVLERGGLVLGSDLQLSAAR